MQYRISYICRSHVGKQRSTNQDNLICNKQYIEDYKKAKSIQIAGCINNETEVLFGVFDGMGGEEKGEVASLLAAKAASKFLTKNNTINDLLHYCEDANASICQYAKDNHIISMGTTAAMLVFGKNNISLCNIGDSKIYRISKKNIEQLSKDHIALSVFGRKPPLYQNLGIPENEMIIEPYVAQGQYNISDFYLICSDGLTDMLESDKILDIILTYPLVEAGNQLLAEALKMGGKDNITFILCEIGYKNNIMNKISKILGRR